MGIYRRKLAKGVRWYYQGMYLAQRYHSKAIYLSKAEAKRAESEKIKDLDEKARNPYQDMLLLNLMEDRLDYLKLKNSHDYYRENRRYFKKALAAWGNIKASQTTKAMVNNLLMKEAKRLDKNGKTNMKVNAMLRALKALFNYGIKIHDLDIKNPCLYIGFYPVDINLKYIPPDEDIAEVKQISTPSQRFLINFVDQTGCRIMEAIRFKYEDIDGGLITLWTRKSKNSNFTPRRIPKPVCLDGLKGKGRVFKEWKVAPRFLEERVKKLGQPKWNWHNLRHRRASIMASESKTLLEIMALLGHSNLSVTQKYLQLLGFTRL